MPNFSTPPQTVASLFAPGTITTSTTSAALTLPSASSYRIICQVGTVSGTSPTMVMAIATSFDGGTTYNEVISTSTINTTGSGQQLAVRPYLGIGDVATTASSTLLGTTDLAAGIVVNGPINPAYIKVRLILGGTSPSFGGVLVQYAAVTQDLSD
jgi:hypothetical protein